MKNAIVEMLNKQLSDRIDVFEKEQEFSIIGELGGKEIRLVVSKTKDRKFYIEALLSSNASDLYYCDDRYPYSYDELLEKLDDLLSLCGENIVLLVALAQYDYYVGKLEYDEPISEATNKPLFVKIIGGNKKPLPNALASRNVINEDGEEVKGISIPGYVYSISFEYAGTIKK